MAAPELVIRVAADIRALKANLAEGVNQIEVTKSSLLRMASSYDGSKIIQQAGLTAAAIQQIGGVSMLTDADMRRANVTLDAALEKYKKLGKEAPPGMQALADATRKLEQPLTLADRATSALTSQVSRMAAAFSVSMVVDRLVGSVVAWTQEAVRSSSALVDLSAKTGMSITFLQQLEQMGQKSGISLDQISDAAFKLGVRLSGGGDSVRQAVNDLGLQYELLRGQKPDEQFHAVAAALSAMENPQERNRVALELFGQKASVLIPMLVQDYKKLKDSVVQSSESQIRAIDASAKRWDAFLVELQGSARAKLGDYVQQLQAVEAVLNRLFGGEGNGPKKQAEDIRLVADAHSSYVEQLQAARAELDKLTPAQLAELAAAQKLTGAVTELAEKYKLGEAAQRMLGDVLSEQTARQKEYAAAAERLAAAQAELDSAGKGWRATLEGIKPEIAEQVRFYLEAGVSQGDLALAFKLTATEVRALAKENGELKKAYEEVERAARKQFDAIEKAANDTAKLWQGYNDFIRKNNLSTHDELLAQVDEFVEAQIAAEKRKGTYTEESHKRIIDASKVMTETLMADIDSIRELSHTSEKEKADRIEATYQFMLQNSHEFTAADIENYRKRAEAARAAANDFGTSFISALEAVDAKNEQSANKMQLSWMEAMTLVSQGLGTMTGQVGGWGAAPQWAKPGEKIYGAHGPALPPGRADGGPVSAGRPYIVGEKRAELFVPERSGFILPSVPSMSAGGAAVASGAGGVNVTININGSVLANKHEIARVVGDAVLESLQGRRRRGGAWA